MEGRVTLVMNREKYNEKCQRKRDYKFTASLLLALQSHLKIQAAEQLGKGWCFWMPDLAAIKLHDLLKDKRADLTCVTETWLEKKGKSYLVRPVQSGFMSCLSPNFGTEEAEWQFCVLLQGSLFFKCKVKRYLWRRVKETSFGDAAIVQSSQLCCNNLSWDAWSHFRGSYNEYIRFLFSMSSKIPNLPLKS